MTERRQLLTSPQVAEILRVSIRTVQRLAESGELKSIKLTGQTGAYVFEPTEVELWQLRREREREEATPAEACQQLGTTVEAFLADEELAS